MLTACLVFDFVILIIALFGAIYAYFKYVYTHWKRMKIPYIEPEFPYGSTKIAIKAIKPLGELFKDNYSTFKANGHKFGGVYFFQNPTLLAVCPDFIKTILIRDFSYFVDRGIYHDEENDPLTAHLMSLSGQKWKNLRAKLSPTFTSGKMKKMFSCLVDCSQNMTDYLKDLVEKHEPIDINNILVKYTTNVIGLCAFGIECNCFKNPNTKFTRMSQKMFRPTGKDRLKSFMSFTVPKITKMLKIKVINNEVDFFFRKLVKDTIEYRKTNNITKNDFLQLLIQLMTNGKVEDDEHNGPQEVKATLTLNEATAQAFLFFLAGFETSSTSLTFCMYELAQNQDIQNKLRTEIVNILKKYEGNITYDALAEMHYLDRVVQESLRKFPPAMLLKRQAIKDYRIPDTDITLKKGSVIFVPVLALQRDPDYYPDPDRFDPDRFTEENKATRPDCTWIPFGEGPRNCIALRFGLMQIKVGLCQLLLNYKFTLNSKTELPFVFDPKSFVSKSLHTIWLDAEKI